MRASVDSLVTTLASAAPPHVLAVSDYGAEFAGRDVVARELPRSQWLDAVQGGGLGRSTSRSVCGG